MSVSGSSIYPAIRSHVVLSAAPNFLHFWDQCYIQILLQTTTPQISDSEAEEKIVGGKAWNLSLLLKQHIDAPGGFVIFAKAFEEYLNANKIDFATCTEDDITKSETAWPDQLTHELAEQIKELAATVSDSTLYAVRSSGLLEDSAKLSFAGIHESILMVDKKDLLKALKECWSSTRTERAINYRKVNDLPESPNLAVLVQPMISSKISGVLFSVNPMTSADEIIVEAAEGYCDQIVSGKVTPEKITIPKKEEMQMKSEIVPPELCKPLRETALKIESYFKYPVDVEWTWDGERLWILQARPITKKGEVSANQNTDGRKDLYSNKNSKEVMGHAVTMMTWSAFNTIINKALKKRYKQKGIKYSKKQPFYELKWGRVFQNVTTTYKLMVKEFGADLKTITKEFEDISPEILKAHLPHEKSNKIKGLSNILGHLFKSKEFIEKAEKNWRQYNEFCLQMRAKELHEYDEKKLFEIFNQVQEEFVDFGKIYMDLQIYLSIFKEVVWQGIEKKENSTQLFASLLTGLGDVVTVEQDEKLLEIAALIKENQEAKEFFKQESDKLDWKELSTLLSERSPIVKELQDFIVKYGYRSRIELEVSQPRWSDAPNDILKFLQISVNATSSTRVSKIDLLEQRHNSEKKVVAAQNIFLRPMYSWAMGKFQAMSRLRENCKAVVVHFIAVQRRILLAIGSKLLEDKKLSGVDELFHLSIEDLETILEDKWDAKIIQEHVTANRTKWLKNRDLSTPCAFFGDEPLFTKTSDVDSMKGTAASPGQVTGKALVLDSPTQVAHIEPGTVLIASTTDPYWTPLFMHVVAVVTEHGGLLSHAAITAREFGLPAVLGVNNITKTIKTGTEVFVDGSNGVIKIIEKTE